MKSIYCIFYLCPFHMIIRTGESSLKRILPFSSSTSPFHLLLSSCSSSLSNKRTINRTPFSLPLNCRDHALKSSEEAEDTRRCLKMSSALPRATKTECPKNNNKAASDRFDGLLVWFFFLALTQMLFLLKLVPQIIC